MDDDHSVIHYATYTLVVTTYDGVETGRTYALKEYTMTYESVANLCSMPTNFLFNLLQESRSPEYVMSVIDLLLEDTELVVMIQDELEVTTFTHEETYNHAKKTEVQTEKRYEGEWVDDGVTAHQESYWAVENLSRDYEFPYGDAIIHTTVVKTYTNIATVFIQKAYTWCLDFEQEAVAKETEEMKGRSRSGQEICQKARKIMDLNQTLLHMN